MNKMEKDFNNTFGLMFNIKFNDLIKDEIQYRDATTRYHYKNDDQDLESGELIMYFKYSHFSKTWTKELSDAF